MSFLDKLMFWKKGDDDLGGDEFPPEPGGNLGAAPPSPGSDLGLKDETGMPLGETPSSTGFPAPPKPPYESNDSERSSIERSREAMARGPSLEPSMPKPTPVEEAPSAPPASVTKDLELISSKLDAIRANIENINSRLANLERIASEGEKPKRRSGW